MGNLGELESVAGEGVQRREAAIGDGALADVDGGAGEQSVLVELVEAMADGLGFLARERGAADQ